MYYEFRDNNDKSLFEHENRAELIKDVREYYKGIALDNENDEFEVCGKINYLDQHQEIISTEQYYATGCMPSRRNVSPYLQSEFV